MFNLIYFTFLFTLFKWLRIDANIVQINIIIQNMLIKLLQYVTDYIFDDDIFIIKLRRNKFFVK